MLQTCHWNSPHFSGYLYINGSWFHLKYTFMALHSVPSCAKSDHLTLISPGYLVQQLSDWNQFVIQYLTVLMIFCMKLFHLNGNKEHFLLSSLMVNTFIGILFPYSNIHLEGGYTPVPTSCPRCPAPPPSPGGYDINLGTLQKPDFWETIPICPSLTLLLFCHNM